MLSVTNLNVSIEGSRILSGLNLEVRKGEFVCLFGRNGSGKTTTLRTIMGYRKPASGCIEFNGAVISGLPTWRIARLGIGFSPEESEVFGELTVLENLELPLSTRPRTGRTAEERLRRAFDIFPKLASYKARRGSELSGGEKKMVSVARAVVLDPKLLLLDEPFEGLSPVIIPEIAKGIAATRRAGCSVLLAKSNIHHIPSFVDRITIIERGEIAFAGALSDARKDPFVNRVITG